MLIKTLSTNLLQIIYKIIFNSKVIVKSIIDPDDNFLTYTLPVGDISFNSDGHPSLLLHLLP